MAGVLHLVSVAAVLAGVAMLVMAALHDVLARTVPNELAAAIAGAGLTAQCAAMGSAPDVGTAVVAAGLSVGAAVLVFVAAALMWRRGWMGGGDVKLLGAAALLMPASLVPTLLMATSLSGGVLAFVYLAARRRLARPRPGRAGSLLARAFKAERWRLRRGGPLPYAVAIASGAFFVLSHGGLP